MTTINIPKDIQDKILELHNNHPDNVSIKIYTTDIITVLIDFTFDNWIYANLLDNGDEITVLQIDKDIFIEFIDHFNRDVTINYYEKYKIED